MVLVDAKVLVDVLADDPARREWSETRLLEIAATEELAINPIIYAEVSAAYHSAAAVERALYGLGLVRLPLPYEAGFIAAQAFVTYRRGAGAKRSRHCLISISAPTPKPPTSACSPATPPVTGPTSPKSASSQPIDGGPGGCRSPTTAPAAAAPARDPTRHRLAFPAKKQDRRMLTLDHSPVSSPPKILGGTLVFQGTRVPAQTLLDYLADGFSADEFLAFFPSVPREDAELSLSVAAAASEAEPGSYTILV